MTDPLPEPPRTARQRWLSRLAFSFIVIAAFLVWQAFHLKDRQLLYLIGALLSLVLGIMGIRERHRR